MRSVTMQNIFPSWRLIVLVFIVVVGGWYLLETYTIVAVGNIPETLIESQQTTVESPLQQTKEYADAGEKDVILSATVEQHSQTSTVVRAALNTHSVNLDGVDFGEHIWIEKDGVVFRSNAHEDDGGNHHRTSTITFPYVSSPFTIVGQDIGGVNQRKINVE
ncbi:MAG: hypothetical protein UX35_C0009G0022 [Microgenomates group bacterium GW2011_GWA1_46_15]|nr:MAG: hypothetical protein UX00_C0017G0008 [Microgenomates group bacterium GW2011_GWB1_45_17]KKU23198.1 MAG: hypothetical protein UX35_C0009G0022 [Microgenomates group bacterium GW2011_GWA1_46_15]KKU24054.1 MAG: hypothetical protein UX36_C0002G0037 [Microgenomates group bacterium GW2011_GWC1_46_15]